MAQLYGFGPDLFFIVKSFIKLKLVKDLIITDIMGMGSSTAPRQMKDAMAFITDVVNDDMIGVTRNVSNTKFTGLISEG